MKILLTTFLLVLGFSSQLPGALIYWVGGTSNSWLDAANWDCACLPTATDDVRLPTGSTVDIPEGSDIVIGKLVSRGTLFIEAGAKLRIDCQDQSNVIGMSFVNGELINEGNLRIQNVNGAPALEIYLLASLTNSGTILVDQVACPAADNCSLRDAISLAGITQNTGTIELRNLRNMDGFSILSAFNNAGNLLGDSLALSGGAIILGQGVNFINTPSGTVRLTNVEGDGLSRGISNLFNNVSLENQGTIEITFSSEEPTGINLSGSGTSLNNDGTIRISGGEAGIKLNNQSTTFSNQGEIYLSGQTESGLSLNSTTLQATNTGSLTLSDGNARWALDLGAVTPGPTFRNAGNITVENYLQSTSSVRGVRVLSGTLQNEGQLRLIGADGGAGIELQANAARFQQPASGTLYIDHFRWGLAQLEEATNAGTIIFGSHLNRAILDNSNPLINTGILGGGARFDPGTLDLMANCQIQPGTIDTTGEIILGEAITLDNSIGIELELAATPDKPEAYDRLSSTQSLNFSGTIQVKLTDDFAVRSGSFTLLQTDEAAGGLGGTPTVQLPEPPAGSSWRIEQSTTNLVLHLDLLSTVRRAAVAQWKVYPNPAKAQSWLQVDTAPGSNPQRCQWFNAQGQLVYESAISASGQVRVPDLPTGLYFLQWQAKESIARSQLVIN